MSISLRGESDRVIDQVLETLGEYERQHPDAQIEAYRRNPVSLRVRIVDPDFRGISRAERHEVIWALFEGLPEEVQSQISLLILLAPEETPVSFANFEFDNPIPSTL